MTTPPITGVALLRAVSHHAPAKPREPQPLPASEVAEMVVAYRRGASIKALATQYHHAPKRVQQALRDAGVTLRTPGQQGAIAMRAYYQSRQASATCRACGIILAKAGCGHHDGVCADCWDGAAKRAERWGVSVEEALERWIRESAEAGATELEEATEAELGEWCGNIKRRVA